MVQHTPTGLIWKRCAEGQTWDGTTCTGTATTYTWQDAFARVDAVNAGTAGENLGQTDWRIPNINELKSIVEQGCYNPAINPTPFPNTPASYFWSASPSTSYSDYAWDVYFLNGDDYWDGRSGAFHVRLVRAGQSFLNFDGGSGGYRAYKDIPHPSPEILYVQPSYSLSLKASDPIVRLVPSASVTHTFMLTNQGKQPDTYDLTVTGSNGILATLQSSNSVTLAPGEMGIIKVQTNTASLSPPTQGLVMLKAVGRGM